jgi:hypothetical protein
MLCSDAKQNYQRLVRIAIEEQDPVRRAEVLRTIRAENARLVHIVEGLVAAWSEYNTDDTTRTKIHNLEAELATFQQDLESIQQKQDSLVQLQSVFSSISTANDSDRNTYYGYIIAVLVLLIIVFILFVYSSMATVVSSSSASFSPDQIETAL